MYTQVDVEESDKLYVGLPELYALETTTEGKKENTDNGTRAN